MDEASRNSAGTLDPRRNAFRKDLAAKSLEGTVKAERYVAGEPAFVVRASVPLRKTPDATARIRNGGLIRREPDDLRRSRGLGVGAART